MAGTTGATVGTFIVGDGTLVGQIPAHRLFWQAEAHPQGQGVRRLDLHGRLPSDRSPAKSPSFSLKWQAGDGRSHIDGGEPGQGLCSC